MNDLEALQAQQAAYSEFRVSLKAMREIFINMGGKEYWTLRKFVFIRVL